MDHDCKRHQLVRGHISSNDYHYTNAIHRDTPPHTNSYVLYTYSTRVFSVLLISIVALTNDSGVYTVYSFGYHIDELIASERRCKLHSAFENKFEKVHFILQSAHDFFFAVIIHNSTVFAFICDMNLF